MARPVGAITRGTTNPNRLRRCDRWLAGPQAWRLRRSAAAPIVVDLGYGASAVTAVELHTRLSAVRPDVQVVGIEIDPDRVAAGRPYERPGLTFRRGGFEVPLDGRQATVVRAFNVLRQYDETQVPHLWATTMARLAPQGLFVDGTCDELGRRAAWVALDATGPVSLTFSWSLRALGSADSPGPRGIAERLPKALIHRNIPGEPIYDVLRLLDEAWQRVAPQGSFGVRQRFLAMVEDAAGQGLPVLDGRSRWRLGEVAIAWDAVAPRGGPCRSVVAGT